jgi:hypothetical protein
MSRWRRRLAKSKTRWLASLVCRSSWDGANHSKPHRELQIAHQSYEQVELTTDEVRDLLGDISSVLLKSPFNYICLDATETPRDASACSNSTTRIRILPVSFQDSHRLPHSAAAQRKVDKVPCRHNQASATPCDYKASNNTSVSHRTAIVPNNDRHHTTPQRP